ncbi:ABC-type cobalamin/Fe3+-siderophores transport system ATPase subunit [Rhodococcus sp. LBL1]|nr:ABC-type cobalamin/Fe3+-siderophores transport system ATPase subunit [Rhodococcus sp. LBL1]MDH6683051.1 ABC-type cobalamin/Fe3+-siderophores transport system ATPase subunit [Rhodococcus sp. LBL2]
MSNPSALLSLRGVAIDRGRRTVLSGLDLDIAPGSVVGLIGPNGSGKTTLLSAIGAGAPVRSGGIYCDETELTRLRPPQRARYVAYVPQHTHLDFDLSVREIVELGTLVTGSAETRESLVTTAMTRAGCAHLADRPASRLSGGESQLVHIARALAQDAPVLVMDEPISALDIAHQLAVLTLARAHVCDADARHPRAVVASLHDIDLAARFCDHLVLLSAGEVVASGPPDEVLDAAVLSEVYGVSVRTSRDDASGALRVTAFTSHRSPKDPV